MSAPGGGDAGAHARAFGGGNAAFSSGEASGGPGGCGGSGGHDGPRDTSGSWAIHWLGAGGAGEGARATRGELVRYDASATARGDSSSVVGYAGILFV